MKGESSEPRIVTGRKRPAFPARAVVTGGMPYGNKDLHFGHIGGVFVQADAFARFLRDRIGPDRVLFVSGTDCYGSPIVEYHRNACATGEYTGSLQEFVEFNHERQQATFDAYRISMNEFAASGMEPWRSIHERMGAWILTTLHERGALRRLTTPQFYDPVHETFLNGRQVIGKCPVQDCRSEKAYADECDLGHQYEPRDLLQPRSTLSGQTPVMRDVTNWYVDLPSFRQPIMDWLDSMSAQPGCRPFVVSYMKEYFEPPTIHITRDQQEKLDGMKNLLPAHEEREGRGKSIQLVFESMAVLETARSLLAEHGLRYRIGKTMVPFRMTGNLEWGLPAPELDGARGLTFWVWPESLWAPISFTAAWLAAQGKPEDSWKEWWCSPEARVYQFIGEDNIFFYGLAQAAIWLGLQEGVPAWNPPAGQLQMTELSANKHILFLDKKASSSGTIKPPMARDLLNFYTSDQLRAHFFSLGLGMRSVGFRPKPFNPAASDKEGDPVLKEGFLLSNTFNRAVRSCFYTAQKFFDGIIPLGEVSREVQEETETAVLDFEETMFKREFHQAILVAGDLIRAINQRWNRAAPYSDNTDAGIRRQALIDAFHQVRTAAVLMHGIAPDGTERIRDYLGFDERFWSWQHIFEPVYFFMRDPTTHRLKFLEPRTDFFPKHPSQLAEDGNVPPAQS